MPLSTTSVSTVRRAPLTGFIVAAVGTAAAFTHADIVSMQLSGGFTSASANVESLVSQGFLPVRFAYVTGGSSQTGPLGTQFFASAGAPQYISIDLGFRTVEFLATGVPSGTTANALLKKDLLTDRIDLSASNSATNASVTLSFLDTRRFLPSQNALPSPFPSASAFSSGNNGWGGTVPAFGFEVFFQHNGRLAWVRGDLFPSMLATAPVPPGVPSPSAAALLTLGGLVATRRRR